MFFRKVVDYMVCYKPLQVSYFKLSTGKLQLNFGSHATREATLAFQEGRPFSNPESIISLPCGSCIGCRLDRSRQWAIRCMHEVSLYDKSCFLTLTYSPENVPSDGSLVKKHFQKFMKRLKKKFPHEVIRYYMCGEYGEKNKRPHYHVCIFGFSFPDAKLWKSGKTGNLYTSKICEKIWGKGFCPFGEVTFQSAAYVSRYCTKKINGPAAKEHYNGLLPEFSLMSLKPGIGYGWYQKWKKDCFPSDYLIVNGVKCKPPRYYDKKLEQENSELFLQIKQKRKESAQEKSDDNTARRLMDMEKCQEARFKKLIRRIEKDL